MTGGIIALIIAVLALIVLIVFCVVTLKKVSHLMKEIDKTTSIAQDKINFFTKDTNSIKSKIDQITQRVNSMSAELNRKMKKIDYFSETTADFQNALDELKKSIERFFSGFFNSSTKQSKQRTFSIFKRTAKKFFKKQKNGLNLFLSKSNN